jgi:hypothetical protein
MMPLRFFADESCDFSVVRSPRNAGYDVLAVAEYMQRSVDRELIEQDYAISATSTELEFSVHR